MTIVKGLRADNLLVDHNSNIYALQEASASRGSGGVWLIRPDGTKLEMDAGLRNPRAIAMSPNALWLAVAESETRCGDSYQIQPDGTLRYKQRFYWFQESDDATGSGAGSWTMDNQGHLFAATSIGVQVFDRNGRVRAILPVPGGGVLSLGFGGEDFRTLYVSCSNHKLYRRRLAIAGVPSWATPIQLPQLPPG